MKRLAVLTVAAAVLGAFLTRDVQGIGNVGQVEGYRFILPELVATPGESISIRVNGEHEKSAQGFSFGARYPAEQLTIDRVHITEHSILDAIRLDYFEVHIAPDEDSMAVAALVDSGPPFEGQLIPNIGFALNFFTIEATVALTASGTLEIRVEDGLLLPPVQNIFAVENQGEPLTDFAVGEIVVAGNVLFLRGDSNMDHALDISDPVMVLESIFRGSKTLPCPLASDANDDETVDISDAIRSLDFLFGDASVLPPPFPTAGFDPTPSHLSCPIALVSTTESTP